MADYINPFEAEEGVTRANFNGRIEQMNAALNMVVPDYGTEEMTAGTTALETGKLYLMYE